MSRWTLAAVAASMLLSCTYVGRYDSKNFVSFEAAKDKQMEGKALVLTTIEDDAYEYTGRPVGFVGSANTLKLPLGVIVREAARNIFGLAFRDGADASTDPQHSIAYRVVVTPHIQAFSYEYSLSSVITQSGHSSLSVHITLLNTEGAVIFEKTYDSGPVEVGSEDQGPQAIAHSAHIAAQYVMLLAAADMKDRLAKDAAALEPSGQADPGRSTTATVR